MKKRILAMILTLSCCVSLVACGSKDKDETKEVTESNTETHEQVQVEVSDPTADFWSQESEDGRVHSILTGEWVDKEVASKRPFACMIENTKPCLPQYGIENAGIIYECVVEGGLTRMMAIFDDYSGLDRIGNIRSSRPYFVYFASEYDAIYMHAGGNPAAFELINGGLVNNLNALELEGSKDKGAAYRTGKGEHTLFTSAAGIERGISKNNYDTALPENYKPHFNFSNDQVTLDDGEACEGLKLYYSINQPYWKYNKDDGMYYRYEHKQKQIDGATGNQLYAKNIIIEDVSWWQYAGSEYLGYYLPNNVGTGKYITNGKMVDITWSKDGDSDITHYYYQNGEEITLNIGKTWIQACQDNYTQGNKFYASADEL